MCSRVHATPGEWRKKISVPRVESHPEEGAGPRGAWSRRPSDGRDFATDCKPCKPLQGFRVGHMLAGGGLRP